MLTREVDWGIEKSDLEVGMLNKQNSTAALRDSGLESPMVRIAGMVFLLVAGAVVFCAFFAGFPLDHDAGVLLQVGDIMLHGGVPYRDIIEITPPMAPAVHIVPILISKVTPLSPPAAFHLCVTFMVVFSCLLLWAFLGKWKMSAPLERRLFFLAGWLSCTLSVQLALDYGQREYLFGLMLAPWLLCRLARYEGHAIPIHLAILLGFVSGPCFMFKPFFLAVVVALELVLVLCSRSIRRLISLEIVLVAGWGIAYFVYLATLPADARFELFNLLIPLLAKHYNVYWGDFYHPQNIVTYIWVAVAVLFAIGVITRYSSQTRLHAYMFLSMVLCCAGAYWVQGKGWFYHQIPIRMSATAMLAYALCCVDKAGPVSAVAGKLRVFVLATGWIVLALPVGYFLQTGYEYRLERSQYTSAMTEKIREYAQPGEYVAFVCTDVRRYYPAMNYAGVKLGSRYDIDFLIPMAYDGVNVDERRPFPYRAVSELTEIDRLFLKRKAEDIAHFRPRLVGVDCSYGAQALPPNFRVDNYLETSGWREEALAGYRIAETYENFVFYVPK